MEIFLPDIKLEMQALSPHINFQSLGSSLFTKLLTHSYTVFRGYFNTSNNIPHHDLKTVLSGDSFEGAEIPYRWQILRNDRKAGMLITYFEDPQFESVFCEIDYQQQKIQITLVPKATITTVTIDPLFQPFGSILMVILAHHQNDILIHASGINDNGTGRLFTGVSGIGKSTMGGLWEAAGAKLINDDRLWLHKTDNQWHIFNTPMPYYAQKPAMAPLKAIFLLNQSPQNTIIKRSGVNAAMRFMANGIQHFYDKEMTGRHLDRVMEIASHVPIYDCGFRPTEEIVREIRKLGR